MKEVTLQEKKLLLQKLINKAKTSNKWSQDGFAHLSTSVCVKDFGKERHLNKASAVRFFKYLMDTGYLIPGEDARKYRPNIPTKYLEDKHDEQMEWLQEIIETTDIFQTRGRIPGVSPRRKEKPVEENVEPVFPDCPEGFNPVTGEWDVLPEATDDTCEVIGGTNHSNELDEMLEFAKALQVMKKYCKEITLKF